MPNGLFRQNRNPLDLFGGGTVPYLSAPGGYGGRAASMAPAPRRTARQRYQESLGGRPEREEPVPISWKRRLAAAAAAFGAGFGGGPQAGLAVGQQITGGPRRAQEAEYQRGLEEWEAGREKAREAYTLGRQSEADIRAGQLHEQQMKAPTPATPQRAHEYKLEQIRQTPRAPTIRVMGPNTMQRDPATDEWKRIGDAPAYPGHEPQLHPATLQKWLSTEMRGLARLKNDPIGDLAVIEREERRIIEQYNKFADTLGEPHITELPGGAGQQQGQPNAADDPWKIR